MPTCFYICDLKEKLAVVASFSFKLQILSGYDSFFGQLMGKSKTLRYALNVVAEVVPIWLKSPPAVWYDRYSKRLEDSRLPRKPALREALAEIIIFKF